MWAAYVVYTLIYRFSFPLILVSYQLRNQEIWHYWA